VAGDGWEVERMSLEEGSTLRLSPGVHNPGLNWDALAEFGGVSISLVVPTMNESKNIPHVFSKIPPIVKEIVVVDSSKDDTVDVILQYAPRAKIIKTEPRGKGNALKLGFDNATGDVIVMIDADGSMDPGEIPEFVRPLLKGFDAVQGSRVLGSSDDLTPLRRFGNYMFVSLVNNLYHADYTDLCYGYRAFRREALDKIEFDSDGFDVETELTIRMKKVGLKICEVPSHETPRIHGESNLSTFGDGWKILSRIFKEMR